MLCFCCWWWWCKIVIFFIILLLLLFSPMSFYSSFSPISFNSTWFYSTSKWWSMRLPLFHLTVSQLKCEMKEKWNKTVQNDAAYMYEMNREWKKMMPDCNVAFPLLWQSYDLTWLFLSFKLIIHKFDSWSWGNCSDGRNKLKITRKLLF